MRPILTIEQMQTIDDAAEDIGWLINNAGRAVARHAIAMMGGTYGRRVVVVAGSGNNGADGRVAATALSSRGVRVELLTAPVLTVGPCDLVVDAVVGAGLSRRYEPPVITGSPLILAVDVPSGLHGGTGADLGGWTADRTVTFGAMSPGHLLGAGPRRCGDIHVAHIGLELDGQSIDLHHLATHDAAAYFATRGVLDHKWNNAVRVWAGGPGMSGAAVLSCAAAMRAGAGIVVAGRPDGCALDGLGVEIIERRSPLGFDADQRRFTAVLIGPGIGRDFDHDAMLRHISESACPVVVDADALSAVASDPGRLRGASSVVVLTPHDGEFERLTGHPPGPERIAAARELAAATGTVVLLKGPTTIVASESNAILVDAGDERLATAGSGDVLAGVIAANLVGCSSVERAVTTVAACAVWHAVAAKLAGPVGVVASDIVEALPTARLDLCGSDGGG